jgi:hypothetical protein
LIGFPFRHEMAMKRLHSCSDMRSPIPAVLSPLSTEIPYAAFALFPAYS